jgi:hypothetical protein
MGQPSIEVRANYLGDLPGFDPHYHLVIVVDDGNGNKTYYRGGPEQGGSSVGSSAATTGTNGSGRSTGGSSGGSGFGDIITEYGPYVPNSIDYDPNAKVIYRAALRPEDVANVKNSLANQMNAIQAAKIDYWPTGPNSNSVVGTAMRNVLNIDLQVPKGMWIPGIDQQLVDRRGQRASADIDPRTPEGYYSAMANGQQLSPEQTREALNMSAQESGDPQSIAAIESMNGISERLEQEQQQQMDMEYV